MLNILSIDLEDYFMVSAFEGVVKREDWARYDSRIERNTYRLLEILDETKCHYDGSTAAPKHGSTFPSSSASRSPLKGSGASLYSVPSALCSSPKATFFCLGWIAERYPHLIKVIDSTGHEIANHGYDHRLVYDMGPLQFREDIRKSKMILEDIIGGKVVGYRAPSYSITRESLWAFEILGEEGYQYDSSIFPIHHDRYGIPNAPRFPFQISYDGPGGIKLTELTNVNGSSNTAAPQHFSTLLGHHGSTASLQHFSTLLTHHRITAARPNVLPQHGSTAAPQHVFRSYHSTAARRNNAIPSALCSTPSATSASRSLIEFPLSTIRLLGRNLPVAGGGYFRMFPGRFTQWALGRINEKDHLPFIFYIHPWEIDADQPRINRVSTKSRIRHYLNLKKTETRLKRILLEGAFVSFKEYLNRYGGNLEHLGGILIFLCCSW